MAKKSTRLPTADELETELRRVRYRVRYGKLLKSTVSGLIVAAAAAALLAALVLPVLQICGTSMNPLLTEGDVVASVKTRKIRRGDVVGFYYANRILVKRVIGLPLDEITVDADGNVYVNGEYLDEPYLTEKAAGECDVEFPCRVPERSYFVMGDSRADSVDSRSAAVGCVGQDAVAGKLVWRLWPLRHIGPLRG